MTERKVRATALFGGGDFGAEAAFGEMGGDGCALGGFGGGAEEIAVGAVDEGVAALEDAQGAEGFELGYSAAEAGVRVEQGPCARRVQALLQGVEAVPVVGEVDGDVLAAKAGFELDETRGAGAQVAGDGRFGAEGEFVEALGGATRTANDGICA